MQSTTSGLQLREAQEDSLAVLLDSKRTTSGANLATLSLVTPILTVFLRHAGCTFCREALSDLAESRKAIEATGTKILIVHLGDASAMERNLEHYGVADLDRIFDKDQSLYRAFGLKQGSVMQLAGPKVFFRGIQAGLFKGHGGAAPKGDYRQMPGVFLIHKCKVVRSFRHRSSADRPLYTAFVKAGLNSEQK